MKRWLVGFWLVVFALWPLAHRGLVAAYGIDPSSFAGWARRAAPQLPLQVSLLKVDFRSAKTMHDIKVMVVSEKQRSTELMEEWDKYVAHRRAFGRFAPPPDALGKLLLAEHGDTGMVMVAVATSTLDRATGTIDVQVEKYPYSAR